MALHGTVRFGTTAPHPASISGRKILDQNGNPFLLPTMSSWGLGTQLSDANITTALEGVAANGFKGVTVWMGGGYEIGVAPTNWNKYTTVDHGNLWSGTPWASSLGAGWAAFDHIVDECGRLGLVVSMSLCGGNGDTGAADDWAAVTNTDMTNAGAAIAARYTYAASPHIVWHVMLDSAVVPGDTRGQRCQAFWAGVASVDGAASNATASTRPVRWMEVDNGATTDGQGWLAVGDFNCSINSMYSYGDDSVNDFETVYGETSTATGDCEPRYVGNSSGVGNHYQQVRERNYSVFIEGGVLVNFGHEDWWTFGGDGLFSDGETWDTVQAATPVVQAGYCWALIDQYVNTSGWAPTSAFVTTGEGTGDTKAAQGTDGAAALAYFPDNRTVQVDTTILTGTGNVRLRWFDPVANSFSTIAASEAQQTGRSVTLPAARGDSTRDFVLVVDLA